LKEGQGHYSTTWHFSSLIVFSSME